MKLAGCFSHARGEALLHERGLGDTYAEARDIVLGTRYDIVPIRRGNTPRMVRERILWQLKKRGWELGTRVFPSSAPDSFERGNYRLDATKKAKSGSVIGLICHFGSSEFGLRQLMLVSEAVRRGIVECGIIALMARETTRYFSGRISCYEQVRGLLQAYGESGFDRMPVVLWGLMPVVMRSEIPVGSAGLHGAVC